MLSRSAGQLGIFSRIKGIQYNWIILISAIPIAMISSGVVYSFGVFLRPIEAEFGWGRAVITGAAGLYMFVHLIVAPFTGWLTDRYGPKIVIGFGGLITGLGVVLTGQVNAVWQLYLYYGLIIGLGMGCIDVPLVTTISKWFVQRRGLMMGIYFSGGGTGMMIMSPAAGGLVAAYGWRPSFLFVSIVAWIVIISCSLFLRKQPEERSLLPSGGNKDEKPEGSAEIEGFTLREAMRTSTFWFFFVSYTCWSSSSMMVAYHLVAHAEDQGISSVTAAAILSIVAGAGVAWRPCIGLASDRWGRRPFLCLSYTGMCIAMIWLSWITSFWMFCLFGVLWGIVSSGVGPITMTWVGELFGMRHLGVIIGFLAAEFGVGAAIGPPLAGYIFDTTGSYTIAFILGAILALFSATIIFLMRPPRKPNRGRVSSAS